MQSARLALLQRMKERQTFACCGLDPDLRRFPTAVLSEPTSDEGKVSEFLQRVVDVTAPYVCAYKAQKAFFDLLSGGHEVLKNIVAYTHQYHPGIPVIVDCKVGDIDNTMQAYLDNVFGRIEADGIVVNPYMGADVMLPCSVMEDKLIVVLVKTSNPGGAIIQDSMLKDGRRLWEYVLDLVVTEWNDNQNMVPVISSAAGLNYQKIRRCIPDSMPILLAGMGAQGGSHENLHQLMNSEGVGVFVNSSREILYPTAISNVEWYFAVEAAVKHLKETLNQQRR